jgi:uncharacterized membrane protein
MDMTQVSLIGWIHTLASVLSLAAGAYVLVRAKGSDLHRVIGKIYVAAMVATGITVFWIYKFDIQFVPFKMGPNVFGLFHYESVFTLALVAVAFFTASRQRRPFAAYAHPVAMVMSYYMLVSALINELFVRVLPLKHLAEAQLPYAGMNVAQSPLARMVQMTNRLVFLAVLAWFIVKVVRSRRRVAALRPRLAPSQTV